MKRFFLSLILAICGVYAASGNVGRLVHRGDIVTTSYQDNAAAGRYIGNGRFGTVIGPLRFLLPEGKSEIYNRLCCLEYVLSYDQLDSLRNTTPDLKPPKAWGRYNSATHSDKFGFLMWTDGESLQYGIRVACGLGMEEEAVRYLRDYDEDLAELKKKNPIFDGIGRDSNADFVFNPSEEYLHKMFAN